MPVTLYTLPGSVPSEVNIEQGGVSGSLREIQNLCEQSLALLIAQYQDSPRLQSLICSYVNRLQELETAVYGVYSNVLGVETSEGSNLDLVGKIVGEARNGRVDADYRRGLSVRVLINISDGKVEQLIEIARLYLDLDSTPGSYVKVREVQPARLEIQVITDGITDPLEAHNRLLQAKSAGIALTSMYSVDGGVSNSFELGLAADYPEKNTTNGLQYVGDPVAVPGGSLLHVIGS